MAIKRLNPQIELTWVNAVCERQDIIVYPDSDLEVPSNLVKVVKYLFGKGSHVVFNDSVYPSKIRIKRATFILPEAKAVCDGFTIKEADDENYIS